ncbi:MAG: c-type cytochrome [Lentisphaeria bacterium]|nr:c-type cytochrome [Lentisphaeria bacterium]
MLTKDMFKPAFVLTFLIATLAFIVSCSKEKVVVEEVNLAKAVKKDKPLVLPDFDDPTLMKGKEIWLANCKKCHKHSLSGHPKIGDKKAWAPRIAQGKEVLYKHAIEGYWGMAEEEMPPRGGNDDLSDADVKSAVDYMVEVSK